MSNVPKDAGLTISCWDLCELSEDDLNTWDIAALNLAAAQGLPGLDAVNVAACLDKLDDWADRVKHETLRRMYRFDADSQKPPDEYGYGNSLARFCCYVLLQVLQEDCGVVYNPDRKFDRNFGDPADLFIHGILGDEGKGGTCATMPVVYVAVARRLGFPVKLVETREHFFFRWDESRGTTIQWEHPETTFWIPPDRFNVEGAGEGIAYFPDSHYIQWPHLWKESDFTHGRYLRSQTTKEELAGFMISRGECFFEYKKWQECLKAYYYARHLAPDDPRYEWLHAKRTKAFRDHEAAMDLMLEMQQERRAARQAIPGVQGHSRQCCCLKCEELRDLILHRSNPLHGPNCPCRQCEIARETVAGMPGHSVSCSCMSCVHVRSVAQSGGSCQCRDCKTTRAAAAGAASLPGHPSGCQCASCLRERSLTQAIPPHGPSCQCWDCLKAREFAEASVGMPGHPPTCQCAGCNRQRVLPQSASPHFPHVPGINHPTPPLPILHSPHQPNIGQPRRDGLPGF